MPHSDSKVLIVDDDPNINTLVSDTLKALNYKTYSAFNGEEALELILTNPVDLVITDISMPKMDGLELCKRIKEDRTSHYIPVIILTGSSSREKRIEGLELGADDFLNKPFDPLELQVRVASLIRLKKYIDELESAEQILFTLASIVAAKDPYTKGHCQRISHNSVVVGLHMGLEKAELRAIQRGGFLHDIGKIAISDDILNKKGKLSPEEYTTIKEHAARGEEICRPLKTLASALPIIHSHHEHIDGKGYPDGLKGDEIPLGARIVAAVDFFDALITDRPYRNGLPLGKAIDMVFDAVANGHLDPNVASAIADIISDTPEMFMTGWPNPLSTNYRL